MKSFRQFIIEKGPIDITGPDGKPTKKGEKFLRNLQKKGALANQTDGSESPSGKNNKRQNRRTRNNQTTNPDIRAKEQAKIDIENTGNTDPRWKKAGEGEFSKGGGKFREPAKPEQKKGSKPKPGSQKLGDTTKGGEVRTNKPKTIQGKKDLLQRSFETTSKNKYVTNEPPTGKQVQQFAKDITGKAADDARPGVGGTKGVGQTKSLKGQTLTGGKFKGATPIDKRSATELRKFAKDPSATENPLSGKTQKGTLKSAAKRFTQKYETAKKAANKYGSRVRAKGAEVLKDIQKTNKDQALKSARIQQNIDTNLKGRMSSASKKLDTNKVSSAYKKELQSKGDKVIEKIRKQNRLGSPKSTPIKNTSNPSNINIDSRYKSSRSYGPSTQKIGSDFNVSKTKVVNTIKPPKTPKVTAGKGGTVPRVQGPSPAPKITYKNFLKKGNIKTFGKTALKKALPGGVKVGGPLAALDFATTFAGEKAKGRTNLGATLASGAKVAASLVGYGAGATLGGGVGSVPAGIAGGYLTRTLADKAIDTVFKPKKTKTKTGPGSGGSGAITSASKNKTPRYASISLDRQGYSNTYKAPKA